MTNRHGFNLQIFKINRTLPYSLCALLGIKKALPFWAHSSIGRGGCASCSEAPYSGIYGAACAVVQYRLL